MAAAKLDFALLFKALGDETRLRIVSMLSDVEVCACDILAHLEITQPTLSHHMKVLGGCGLVKSRKDGAWMRYRLNEETVTEMQRFLEGIRQGKDSLGKSS